LYANVENPLGFTKGFPYEKGALFMAAAILYRDELKEYDFGPGHPFRGERFKSFMSLLEKRLPPDDYYQIRTAEPATTEDLLKICDQDYIDFTREYFHAAHGGWVGYYENFNRYHSLDNKPMGIPGNVEEAARLIVGQAKEACDLVQRDQYKQVVSIGGGLHHAKRRFGEGFCIYNDVAFAGVYLVENYQLERVMVLDTDAHAGNGTAEYFRASPNILYVDIHQDPRTMYPGTGFISDIGVDAGKGLTVNIPMPVRAGDASYLKVLDEIVLPLATEFKPEIIIRNGGSDPYYDDGLTHLGMTIAGFRMMGEKVHEIAEICQGKQIDLLTSGYNESILPFAWLSLVSGLADLPVAVEEPKPIPAQLQIDLVLPQIENVIKEVKTHLRQYWKCFR
jgi:acetoin utilization protein AcuC